MRSKLLVGGLGAAVAFLLATNPVVVQAAGVITSADIVNNTIKGKDVRDSSLTGKDIKDGSITGADVNESSLSTVTSASNATNLNGLPASAYQDQVLVVALTPSSGVSNFTKNLPAIPNGTYEVNMNVSADLSGPNSFSCLINQASSPLIHQYGASYSGNFYSINASRVVTVTGPMSIFCTVNTGTFSSPSFVHPANQISFIPLDTRTAAGTASKGQGRDGTEGGGLD